MNKNTVIVNKKAVIAIGVFALLATILGTGTFFMQKNNGTQQESIVRVTRSDDGLVKVTAKGDIPKGYTIKAHEVSEDESINKNTEKLLSEDTEIISAYDISITDDNGSEYQPRESRKTVTLFIESDDFRRYDEIEVCHIPDKGKATKINAEKVRDDAIVLETDGFSTYVFGGKSITTDNGKTATYLLPGAAFNMTLKGLVGSITTPEAQDTTIKSIVWSDSAFTSKTTLQADGEPVYARLVGTQVQLYTAADKVYFNEDSSYMFLYFTAATEISIPYNSNKKNQIDTSLVKNMSYMFAGCERVLTLGKEKNNMETGVMYWDTSSVTDMQMMFAGCQSLIFDCSYWNTENLETATAFAAYAQSLAAIDLSLWNTEKLTNVSYMFEECTGLKEIVIAPDEGVSMAKVTNFDSVFHDCTSLTEIDLSGVSLQSSANNNQMFEGDYNLKKIHSPQNIKTGDIELPGYKWFIDDNGDEEADSEETYYILKKDAASHVYVQMPYDYAVFRNGTEFQAMIKYMANPTTDFWLYYGEPGTIENNIKSIEWTDEDISSKSGAYRADKEDGEGLPIWVWYDENAKTIYAHTNAKKVYLNENGANMFRNLNSVEQIPLVEDERIDTSRTTTFWTMFMQDRKLKSLDLSGWDSSKVTDTAMMFSGDAALENIDVSTWDTGNFADMSQMFRGCKALTTIDVTNWNVSNVKIMFDAFEGCVKLKTLPVSKWELESATDVRELFTNCTALEELDVSGWGMSNVTGVNKMFCNCVSLKALDVSKWDTAKIKNTSYMFQNTQKIEILDVSGWNMSACTAMNDMFSGMTKLKELDTSGWNAGTVVNMQKMFSGDKSLERLDATGIKTDKVSNMFAAFAMCSSLKELNLTHFNVAKVTNMGSLFQGVTVSELDLSTWKINTSCDTAGMLSMCPKLQKLKAPKYVSSNTIIYLPDTQWMIDNNGDGVADNSERYTTVKSASVSNIYIRGDAAGDVNMDYTVLQEGTVFNTLLKQNVHNDTYSFDTEERLIKSIEWTDEDISQKTDNVVKVSCNGAPTYAYWNESKKTYYLYTKASKVYLNKNSSYLLSSMLVMTKCPFLSDERIDTSDVKTLSYAFSNDKTLTTLDVSKWNTSNLTNLNRTFYNTNQLKNIDVSKWDVTNVTNIAYMFYNNISLRSLDLSQWKTPKLKQMGYAFYRCYMLKEIDISGFESNNEISDIESLFQDCAGLTKVTLPKKLTVAKNIFFGNVFEKCTKLEEIDLSGWNVEKVTSFYGVFGGCQSLKTVDLSGWVLSEGSGWSETFTDCASLVMIKAPKTTPTIATFPAGGTWIIDDDGDGKSDDGDTYTYWKKHETVSHTYINSTIRIVAFKVLNDDYEIPNQVFSKNDTSAKVVRPDAEKVGYKIYDWYTDQQCTKLYDFDKPVTTNLILWGKFERYRYTITFDPNGGILHGDSTKEVSYGSFYGTLPTVEYTGKYFGGWRTPSGKVINPRNIVLIEGDTTFTAYWSDVEIIYTVNFESNGGSKVPSQKIKFGGQVTEPKATKNGYAFAGWYDSEELENEWNFSTDAVYDDMTLYAKWKPTTTYKVAFVTGDGVFSDGKNAKYAEVTEGDSVSAPEEPTRDKFLFAGWSADGATLFDLPFVPDRNMTLYAVWRRTVFSVALDANGGEFSDGKQVHNIEVNKDETVGIVETPTREGYTFKGWYYDGKSQNMNSPVGRDMTIFAIWSRDDDIDETPTPDDGGYIPADTPHDTGNGWTFKVIDGVPQVIRGD